MPRKSFQPAKMLDGTHFAMAQVVKSQGESHLHIAGQTAIDETGAQVGDDFASQLKASLENVRIALEAAGATPKDLVRVTTYIVDLKPELLENYVVALSAFFDSENLPACSMIGVQALAQPGLLIEVEATAVLDND